MEIERFPKDFETWIWAGLLMNFSVLRIVFCSCIIIKSSLI